MNLVANVLFPTVRGVISGGIAYGIERRGFGALAGRVFGIATFEMTVLYRYQRIFTDFIVTKEYFKESIENYLPKTDFKCRVIRNIIDYSTHLVQLALAMSVTYYTFLYFGMSMTFAQLFKAACILIASQFMCEVIKTAMLFVVMMRPIQKQIILIHQYDNTFLNDIATELERNLFSTKLLESDVLEFVSTAYKDKLSELQSKYKQMPDDEKGKASMLLNSLNTALEEENFYISILEKF